MISITRFWTRKYLYDLLQPSLYPSIQGTYKKLFIPGSLLLHNIRVRYREIIIVQARPWTAKHLFNSLFPPSYFSPHSPGLTSFD